MTDIAAPAPVRPLASLGLDYYVPEDPMDAVQCDSCQ